MRLLSTPCKSKEQRGQLHLRAKELRPLSIKSLLIKYSKLFANVLQLSVHGKVIRGHFNQLLPCFLFAHLIGGKGFNYLPVWASTVVHENEIDAMRFFVTGMGEARA